MHSICFMAFESTRGSYGFLSYLGAQALFRGILTLRWGSYGFLSYFWFKKIENYFNFQFWLW